MPNYDVTQGSKISGLTKVQAPELLVREKKTSFKKGTPKQNPVVDPSTNLSEKVCPRLIPPVLSSIYY
jgi:hypothetical protein